MPEPIRVLFLCTHNSARSQIAEATLRQMGGEDFAVSSAGTEVTRVHPLALRVLQEQGIETASLHSKSLTDFLGQRFDVVITVCDRANESCPILPCDPERFHWSIPD
ncbi:MAG: arsenate reductase ArsC, partial [Thermomicrobia bacterium]|nr:arsenate reductase ArsC [Thermomicrobia bacterium]